MGRNGKKRRSALFRIAWVCLGAGVAFSASFVANAAGSGALLGSLGVPPARRWEDGRGHGLQRLREIVANDLGGLFLEVAEGDPRLRRGRWANWSYEGGRWVLYWREGARYRNEILQEYVAARQLLIASDLIGGGRAAALGRLGQALSWLREDHVIRTPPARRMRAFLERSSRGIARKFDLQELDGKTFSEVDEEILRNLSIREYRSRIRKLLAVRQLRPAVAVYLPGEEDAKERVEAEGRVEAVFDRLRQAQAQGSVGSLLGLTRNGSAEAQESLRERWGVKELISPRERGWYLPPVEGDRTIYVGTPEELHGLQEKRWPGKREFFHRLLWRKSSAEKYAYVTPEELLDPRRPDLLARVQTRRGWRAASARFLELAEAALAGRAPPTSELGLAPLPKSLASPPPARDLPGVSPPPGRAMGARTGAPGIAPKPESKAVHIEDLPPERAAETAPERLPAPPSRPRNAKAGRGGPPGVSRAGYALAPLPLPPADSVAGIAEQYVMAFPDRPAERMVGKLAVFLREHARTLKEQARRARAAEEKRPDSRDPESRREEAVRSFSALAKLASEAEKVSNDPMALRKHVDAARLKYGLVPGTPEEESMRARLRKGIPERVLALIMQERSARASSDAAVIREYAQWVRWPVEVFHISRGVGFDVGPHERRNDPDEASEKADPEPKRLALKPARISEVIRASRVLGELVEAMEAARKEVDYFKWEYRKGREEGRSHQELAETCGKELEAAERTLDETKKEFLTQLRREYGNRPTRAQLIHHLRRMKDLPYFRRHAGTSGAGSGGGPAVYSLVFPFPFPPAGSGNWNAAWGGARGISALRAATSTASGAGTFAWGSFGAGALEWAFTNDPALFRRMTLGQVRRELAEIYLPMEVGGAAGRALWEGSLAASEGRPVGSAMRRGARQVLPRSGVRGVGGRVVPLWFALSAVALREGGEADPAAELRALANIVLASEAVHRGVRVGQWWLQGSRGKLPLTVAAVSIPVEFFLIRGLDAAETRLLERWALRPLREDLAEAIVRLEALLLSPEQEATMERVGAAIRKVAGSLAAYISGAWRSSPRGRLEAWYANEKRRLEAEYRAAAVRPRGEAAGYRAERRELDTIYRAKRAVIEASPAGGSLQCGRKRGKELRAEVRARLSGDPLRAAAQVGACLKALLEAAEKIPLPQESPLRAGRQRSPSAATAGGIS